MHPHDSDKPLEECLPPPTTGIDPWLGVDRDAPFWRPGFGDLLRHMGWRVIFLLPFVAVLALLAASIFYPSLLVFFYHIGFKWSVVLFAIPVLLLYYGWNAAVRARRDPFCIHCGHSLIGLPSVHRCPECGRPYDLKVNEDYRRDPAWFVQRWRSAHTAPRDGVTVTALPTKRQKRRDGT